MKRLDKVNSGENERGQGWNFLRIKRIHSPSFWGILLLVATLSSCLQDHLPPTLAPGPVDWMAELDPEMKAVLDELTLLNPTPLWQLSTEEARKKPTVKDAVNSLLAKRGIQPKMPNVTTSEITVAGSYPTMIRAVMYKPVGLSGPLPLIVYYHGGGWVLASPEVYEASAKALAEKVGAIVVSVDYHLTPENKFATAHVDCYRAYKWVKENAVSLGGDAMKVAVAGESAGGNMSVGVCMMARDSGFSMPLHQVLVYPVANNDLNTESYIKYQNAKPLDKPLIEWFTARYFKTPADGDSPLISLVDVANLSGLPPATIIGAQIDPLQTEGQQLRDQLMKAGVKVTYQLYEGVTHEFFGASAVVSKAGQAQDLAASQLRAAFQ